MEERDKQKWEREKRMTERDTWREWNSDRKNGRKTDTMIDRQREWERDMPNC
jgi:hypothetical protein